MQQPHTTDVTFEHRMVAIPGIRLHCVVGGTGSTIVLVAGFPQTCYAWRRVMPLLAQRFRVIAVDLPGQGDSDKPKDGYDTRTAAYRVDAALKAGVSASTFSRADIDEYERAYAMPGGVRGMLGYYRAVIEDMAQNRELFARKLRLPILALSGDGGSAPDLHAAMHDLGEDVRGGVIADCGHYIPEEQPEALAARLLEFAGTLDLGPD